MRIKLALVTILASLTIDVAGAPTSGQYVDDQQRFFVEGQPLTDAIESANAIICYMAAMRPDALVNAGPYVAKFYEDRCETTGGNQSSEEASATATSAESSTTASSADGATSYETEQASQAILQVVRETADDPVSAKVWVDDEAQDAFDFDKTIYVEVEQTAGVSDDAPNGDFQMWFSGHSNGVAEFFEQELETQLGAPLDEVDLDDAGIVLPKEGEAFFQGYLKASGSEIKYKEFSFDGENNIALNYLDGGDISGIYGQQICIGCNDNFGEGEPDPNQDPGGPQAPPQAADPVQATLFYQFYVRKQTKTYCRALVEAVRLCLPNDDSEECLAEFAAQDKQDAEFNAFEPIKLVYGLEAIEEVSQDLGDPFDLLDEEGSLITEQCFSMDRDDATRNVFRYGVYEADGDRLSTGETGAFPIFAEVEREETTPNGETVTKKDRVFGFADYWGVFIDPRGRQLIQTGADGTEFKKEVFGPSLTLSDETFTLETTELRVEKRTKAFIALEDIDQIKIAMHIQDPFWATEYQCLLGLGSNGCDSEESETNNAPTPDGPFGGGGDVFNLTLEGFKSDEGLDLSVQELEGYYDADEGQFIFNRAISFEQGYYAKDLESGKEITFSPADWVSTMAREFDEGFDQNGQARTRTEIRPMGVWSNDTRQWYDISAAALSDPELSDPEPEVEGTTCPTDPFASQQTSSCRGGIRTETTEIVSPADLEGLALVCIRDCVDPVSLETAFTEAVALAENSSTDGNAPQPGSTGTTPPGGGPGDPNQPGGDQQIVTSPFANVGPYLKSTVSVFEPVTRFENSGARNLVKNFHASSQPLETSSGDTFQLADQRALLIDRVLVRKADWDGQTVDGQVIGLPESVLLDSYLLLDKAPGVGGVTGPGPYPYAIKQGSGSRINLENLNALIAGQGGKSPVLSLDLKAIPADGVSGTTKVLIKLDRVNDGASLSTQVWTEWESEGPTGGFTMTVPATDYTVAYVPPTGSGAGVTAVLRNQEPDVFAYGGGVLSNLGRPGFTLRMLHLLNGNNDTDANGLSGALGNAMDQFFAEGERYQLTIKFLTNGEFDPDSFGTNSTPVTFKMGEGAGNLSEFTFEFQVGSSAPDATSGQLVSARTYAAGEYWDGIRLSEAVTYEPSASGLGMSVGGVALTKGDAVNALLAKATDPFQALGDARYKRPGQDFGDNLSWGVRTGDLVAVSAAKLAAADTSDLGDLATIECNKFNNQYEDHPAFTGAEETEFRLCERQLFQSPSLTTYQIQIDTQPAYALIDAAGDPVVIASPKTLYYDVPEDGEVFGEDAGKRISLEFAGHGQLRGIPGFVYDPATGENLGEFVREWKPSYRFINRFNIPDGGTVSDIEGNDYFVKALDGEEWLKELEGTDKIAASEDGNYSLTRDDLVRTSTLKIVKSVIGEPPAEEALINDGNPAVIHGEVVFSE